MHVGVAAGAGAEAGSTGKSCGFSSTIQTHTQTQTTTKTNTRTDLVADTDADKETKKRTDIKNKDKTRDIHTERVVRETAVLFKNEKLNCLDCFLGARSTELSPVSSPENKYISSKKDFFDFKLPLSIIQFLILGDDL